ncbi:MAG: hypothetical protein AVDCRST_MAG67-74, partial [uncultured Solirubrobacteraceae bacterium]
MARDAVHGRTGAPGPLSLSQSPFVSGIGYPRVTLDRPTRMRFGPHEQDAAVKLCVWTGSSLAQRHLTSTPTSD